MLSLELRTRTFYQAGIWDTFVRLWAMSSFCVEETPSCLNLEMAWEKERRVGKELQRKKSNEHAFSWDISDTLASCKYWSPGQSIARQSQSQSLGRQNLKKQYIYNIIFKSKLIFINILCIYIYMWNICKFCWKINTHIYF